MILIDDAAWTDMVGHAESAYPDECCGILLGDRVAGGHRAVSAVPCVNQAGASSRARFLIDPEHLLEVRQQGLASGHDIVGFYHSHPDKGAFFSDTDIQHCWPLFANVVLSVEQGHFREAVAFSVDQQQTRAEPMDLIRAETGLDPQ
jgi:proteasome lid subunit RPN8/RPN11